MNYSANSVACPETIVATPFGKAYVRALSADQLVIEAAANNMYLTVNRVKYRVTMYFVLDDNQWVVSPRRKMYADRVEWSGNYYKDQMSDAAVSKLKAKMTDFVRKWVTTQPDFFNVADQNARRRDTQRLIGHIKSKQKEASVLNQEIQHHLNELSQLDIEAAKEISDAKIALDKSEVGKITVDDCKSILKDVIGSLVPQYFTPDFVKNSDEETIENETIGTLISQYTEFDGARIMQIAIAALEDSNYHTVASKLRSMSSQLMQ